MVAYTNLGCLQTAFDTLTGIFNPVGLKKNVKKTVGMVCHPCRAAGVREDKTYNQKMTGARRRHKEQHP